MERPEFTCYIYSVAVTLNLGRDMKCTSKLPLHLLKNLHVREIGELAPKTVPNQKCSK